MIPMIPALVSPGRAARLTPERTDAFTRECLDRETE